MRAYWRFFRDADAFEPSLSIAAPAKSAHVAGTAEAAKVREGMIIVRTLDGIVKNKYANNPGKLAAWISESTKEKDVDSINEPVRCPEHQRYKCAKHFPSSSSGWLS